MNYEIKQVDKFKFVEVGEGEPLVLLHGLFGALSNFKDLVEHFRHTHKVVVPILPLFDLDIFHTTVGGLEKHVQKFIETMDYQNVHLLGNSLGGSYPKRGDYEYIKKKVEITFYDPAVATKELVDEVFEITNNRLKVIKIISLAKSAIRNNLGEELNQIKVPTCLIWGNNDIVTPPFVGREFNKLITSSELHIIDHCGHAPMMEVPVEFNKILEGFLARFKQQ